MRWTLQKSCLEHVQTDLLVVAKLVLQVPRSVLVLFWARSSAKVSLTAFSFSTPSLAAFFGGLTLGWFNGHQFFTTELFSCFFDFSLVQIGLNGSMSIFVRLLISSSVFFSDYYHFWRKNLWKLFKSLHSQRMTLRRFILTVERDSYSFFSFIYQFLTPDFWNLSLLKVFSTYLLVFTVLFDSKKNFITF